MLYGVQTMYQAVLFGGCQICTGTSTTADPSTDDSADLWLLDFRSLTQTPIGSHELSAHWLRQRTLGFPRMPPRKGFAAEVVGCDSHNAHAACSLFVFGGWNPRWPADLKSTENVQKLDLDSMSWSIVPADDDLVRPLKGIDS
jgi:hypothetical protein